MSICLGCLKDKKLNNNYCVKCIKELFDGIVPKELDFDKNEFYIQRDKLASRMSISGVQDKISLKFENSTLITTATNGRYILKPIPSSSHIKNKDDVIFNEHLSMLISKEIFKIPTASCGLIKFNDGEMAYITKRFDYELSSDLKYDQEDFASILDVSSAKDGANAIKLNVSASVVVLEDFFKRILLNYLISNGDAHLKNFGLLFSRDFSKIFLSPVYDVVNTTVYIHKDKPALMLGGKKVWWGRDELENFGVKSCLLTAKEVKIAYEECAKALKIMMQELREYMDENPNFKTIGNRMLDTFELSLEHKTMKELPFELTRTW